jgi:hypothetical protein
LFSVRERGGRVNQKSERKTSFATSIASFVEYGAPFDLLLWKRRPSRRADPIYRGEK